MPATSPLILRAISQRSSPISAWCYEQLIMSAVNEALIRDVVAEVLGRLNGSPAAVRSAPAPSPSAPAPGQSCGCDQAKIKPRPSVALRGKFGVFQDANEAGVAAHEAFLQLQEKGVVARRQI